MTLKLSMHSFYFIFFFVLDIEHNSFFFQLFVSMRLFLHSLGFAVRVEWVMPTAVSATQFASCRVSYL